MDELTDAVRSAPGDHAFLNGGLVEWERSGMQARSAIHHRVAAAGASFARRAGWLVPVALPGDAEPGEGPWLADLSHVAKLEVRGGPEPPAASDRQVRRIAPGRWLIFCRREDRLAVLSKLRPDATLALDVTGAWTVVGLAGSGTPQLLRRLTTARSLPAAAPVADVPGHVFARDGVTWLAVSSEYGQHLWDVAMDDGEALGIRAIGVDHIAARFADPLLC